jgi:potassium channel subfamily K
MTAHAHKEPEQPNGSQHGKSKGEEEEEKRRQSLTQKDSKRKRWWNVWKKWEGQESDWWFASTGIPVSHDLYSKSSFKSWTSFSTGQVFDL